jgi:hypothetical protein
MKCLRGLNSKQARPFDHLFDAVVTACQRVGHWQNRHGRIMIAKRRKQTVDHRNGAKGAGRVMDEHDVCIQLVETGANAVAPLSTALNEVAHIAVAQRIARLFLLAGTDDDPHPVYVRMSRQCVDRMGEDGFPAKQPKLFWHVAAHSAARPRGDD